MSPPVDERSAQEHDRLWREASRLTRGELLLHGAMPGRLGWFARRRLARAMSCLTRALRIAPDRWQTLWMIGKVHQRLEERESALKAFSRAHEINPAQPDVAREAAAAAMEMGQAEAAVHYCRSAVAGSPNDPGLMANLACALLIDKKPKEALDAAIEALRRDPADPITIVLKARIEDVITGRRRQPNTLRDLSR